MIPSIYPLIGLFAVIGFGVLAFISPHIGKFRHPLMVALAVGLVWYGGAKHGAPTFRYMTGVRDNGSSATNGLVVAKWNYDAEVIDKQLNAAYRNVTMTNATGEVIDTWHRLKPCSVIDTTHTWKVADAEKMEVLCWVDPDSLEGETPPIPLAAGMKRGVTKFTIYADLSKPPRTNECEKVESNDKEADKPKGAATWEKAKDGEDFYTSNAKPETK